MAVAYSGVGSSYLNQFTWTWLIGKAADCKSVLGGFDSLRPLQVPFKVTARLKLPGFFLNKKVDLFGYFGYTNNIES